ncbi:MAG: glycosyltransferase, partial [Phycisphaerae bacterium]|nr:glycosyltransferase [Phycisphaerae bacterium]
MADFLLFTQTQWSEAPRIRHQVARMLLDAGHRVFFFERPNYPWASVRPAIRQVEPRLTLVQTTRLFHHQVRVVSLMHRLNAWVTSVSIRRRLRECKPSPEAVVINFAHDYYFLRAILPKSRIVTLIHDDFEAQSRLPFSGHIAWSLGRTCAMSDEVFAVSTPLQDRLREWSTPKLLLPWSVTPYKAPHGDATRRDTLLFWGYVDSAIDLDVVRGLSA